MGFFDFLKGPDINQGVKEYNATDGAVLLDVRTPDEYRQGHIPGSKNVPLQSIDKVTVVYLVDTGLADRSQTGKQLGHICRGKILTALFPRVGSIHPHQIFVGITE